MATLGLELKEQELKVVEYQEGKVLQTAVEPLPPLVAEELGLGALEAVGPLLKEVLRRVKIRSKRLSVVLRPSEVFVRRLRLPLMSEEQLRLNLPYEFRDYTGATWENFTYDYALLGRYEEEEGNEEMDLLAAAVAKETVENYRQLAKRAGLRLTVAIPQEAAYMNLLRQVPDHENHGLCFVDLEESQMQLHIYHGHNHEASRLIPLASPPEEEGGGGTAVLTRTRLTVEAGVELQRALNFYSYSNPGREVESILLGGSQADEAIQQEMSTALGRPVVLLSELFPACPLSCMLALGVALQ